MELKWNYLSVILIELLPLKIIIKTSVSHIIYFRQRFFSQKIFAVAEIHSMILLPIRFPDVVVLSYIISNQLSLLVKIHVNNLTFLLSVQGVLFSREIPKNGNVSSLYFLKTSEN